MDTLMRMFFEREEARCGNLGAEKHEATVKSDQ